MSGKIDRVKELLQHPGEIFMTLGYQERLNWLPDKTFLEIAFKNRMGKKLDLENPQTFSEKLTQPVWSAPGSYACLLPATNLSRYPMIGSLSSWI